MEAALVAFSVVFVAELGDKTQLVALGLATRYRLSIVVAGLGIAYAATQGLAALLGGVLGAALPQRPIAIGAALVFFAFAAWTFRDRADDDDEDELDTIAALGRGSLGMVAGIVGAMMLAELGDKSMLATATIAADKAPIGAWLGATLGISASGGLAVVVGRMLGARIPVRTTQLVSASLFVLFGVLMLADAWR